MGEKSGITPDGARHTSRGISRLLLVAIPIVAIIALGWLLVIFTIDTLTDAVITVYQRTELEVVRGVARSIEYYVGSKVLAAGTDAVDVQGMEQEIFRLFVDPVRLLSNGDAWIYAPDHVVYDESSDFPDMYRGRSMAEIFEIQKRLGARHYEEMTRAVMSAEPGTGWYVWLPDKGREIAAWAPARFGKYVWTIGLSTPLPEILQSTGVSGQVFNSLLGMWLGTAVSLVIIFVWILTERRRWREERLTTAQKDLSTALSSIIDLEQGLDLCLAAVLELSSVEAAAVLIKDTRTGSLGVKKSAGRVELLSALLSGGSLDPAVTRYAPESFLPLSRWIWGTGTPAGRNAVIPLLRGSDILGCLAAGSRRRTPFTRQARRALESFTALAAGMVLRTRLEQERTELSLKLQRAQRMESLGMLAGGVAHDLNNLLTPIVGYTDILLQEVDAHSDMREPLVMLRGVGEKAGAIVQDLLILGRKGPHQARPLDLNAAVGTYLESADYMEIKARYPRVIVSWTRAARALPFAGSLPHVLKACQNLALNACETMPSGGVLRICTEARELSARHVGYEAVEPGAYAVLEYRDTGSGIDAKDLEHIFEPFYTKKKMGRTGTGLGLAVVYGIIHDHGGRIDVRTEPAAGTVISLWFPLTAEAAAQETRAASEVHGGERVMVVEDQPEQRAMATRLLERAGYTVVTAEHGHAAIELLKRQPVDIMLLDMIMEDSFDGLDCYRQAIVVRPGQKAIIVSGFAETERVTEALRLGAGAFIRKPYRMNVLLQAIRDELERA